MPEAFAGQNRRPDTGGSYARFVPKSHYPAGQNLHGPRLCAATIDRLTLETPSSKTVPAPTASLTLLHRPLQARILPRRSSRLPGPRRYPAVPLTSGLHNHGTGLICSPGNPDGIGLFYYPAPGQGSPRSTSGSKAQAARCNTFESRPRRRLTRLRFLMAPPGSITGAPGNALRASVLIAPTSG